jgi:hypothetical protein
MSSEEIQQLQKRILELENQQKEKDENYKKTSLDYNFKVINDFLQEKKPRIEYLLNTSYKKKPDTPSETRPQSYPPDYDLVHHLEAVYNILKIVDERLQKLEQIGV